MASDQINVFSSRHNLCLEIIGFTDSFNFEKKMYSDSSFLNVFGFGGPKIKCNLIRRDIDISQISITGLEFVYFFLNTFNTSILYNFGVELVILSILYVTVQ